MKYRALAGFLACLAASPALAQTPFPSTGGGGSGGASPASPIYSIQYDAGTGAFGSIPIGTGGRVLIDQGAGAVGAFKAIGGDIGLTKDGIATVNSIGGVAVSLGGALTTTGASSPTLAFPASGTPTYTFPAASASLAPTASPNFSGHLRYNGASPTLSVCGTSPAIDSNATDNAGTVTVGSAATGCVITFATAYSSFNHCRVTSQGAITGLAYSYTKSAITVSASVLGGDLIDYNCDGA